MSWRKLTRRSHGRLPSPCRRVAGAMARLIGWPLRPRIAAGLIGLNGLSTRLPLCRFLSSTILCLPLTNRSLPISRKTSGSRCDESHPRACCKMRCRLPIAPESCCRCTCSRPFRRICPSSWPIFFRCILFQLSWRHYTVLFSLVPDVLLSCAKCERRSCILTRQDCPSHCCSNLSSASRASSPPRGRHGDNEPTFLSFPSGRAHNCNAESSPPSTEPPRSRPEA